MEPRFSKAPQLNTMQRKLSALQQKLKRYKVEPGDTIEECKRLLKIEHERYRAEKADRKWAQEHVYKFFVARYGGDNHCLSAWQKLCEDVDVESGESIAECKRNIQAVYVYIYHFVDAVEAGEKVERQPDHNHLNFLCYGDGIPYPLWRAKGNDFLGVMLRRISEPKVKTVMTKQGIIRIPVSEDKTAGLNDRDAPVDSASVIAAESKCSVQDVLVRGETDSAAAEVTSLLEACALNRGATQDY